MEKIKVLYIDDEEGNLNAFKASFRRLFEIYTANSADEGIKILKSHPIEVVIADQRMPNKTGVAFFESILDMHPNPIRILLTAYSDINAIIDAINKGQVYRYITKPWNDYELKLTIENAYQLYCLKEQNNKLNLKYKKVFSESTDPIILFDTKGRIIDYNKATLSLVNNNTLNFSSFSAIINDKQEAKYIMSIIAENGKIKDYECQVVAKGGQKKICLISGNIITNNYGKIISYQAIIKDITERSKMNQLLLKKTIETQEQERERISRDLHDGIGQSLAAIKLHLESLKANHFNNQNIDNELKVIPEILKDAIQDLRQICFNTLPLVLQEYGLVKAIEEIQTKVSNSSFDVQFIFDTNFPDLQKSLEISIFRIIQEFINNSIKHSQATEVTINLKSNDETIILSLKDNGIGFNINDLELFKGHGLKNVKTRIESFKGDIKINSILNSGTEFNIAIPIHLN